MNNDNDDTEDREYALNKALILACNAKAARLTDDSDTLWHIVNSREFKDFDNMLMRMLEAQENGGFPDYV